MAEPNDANLDRLHPPSRPRAENNPNQAALRQRALRANAGNNADPSVNALALANLSVGGNPRAENPGRMHLETRNDNVNAYSDEDYEYLANSGSLNGWSMVEVVDGTPPASRSLHAAAILNDVFYCFGGYDGLSRVNTFHAFSFAEKRWSPVLPSANSAGPPSPRDRHVAVAFGNSFYVHGGFNGTSRVSDFWLFDLSSMCWREVAVLDGRPPSPRHSHSAVVHGHSLYIYGGYDGSYKSDLHEFDFNTSRWSLVPTTGRRPRARYRATTVVHKNYIILYGGHDGTRHLSDTHIFDIENRVWSPLVTEGSIIPRDSHIAVAHSNSMYIFGGSSGSAMNDLFELQLPSNFSLPARWRQIKSSGLNEPLARFCHVGVSYNDALFVFGGYDGATRLNDFVRFDFAVYDLSFEVPSSTLVSEFRALVNNETLSDVTFIVEGIPVYAHKLFLMRCSYFQALMLGDMKESKMKTIRIEQVSHATFLKILEYLYTDQLRIYLDCAMELFEAADLFCIPRLKTMCEKRMLQSINVENAAAIFHAADLHSAMALREKAKKFILSHFEPISKTTSFEEMGRSNIDLVFELLQNR